MFLKNKTFYFLILGFVFLFLVYRLYFFSGPNDLPKEETGAIKIETATSSEAKNSAENKKEIPLASTLEEKISAPADVYYKVVKIVDGDTIDITIDGQTERLRLIGINTPEVVDPRQSVECFGREASANAKKLLAEAEVKISADETQDNRDKYGRLLRYVWRRDGLFYNLEAIKDGFAYEYTYNLPYLYQKDFQAAQKYAQENKLGLWANGACGQKNIQAPAEKTATSSGDACLIKGNIGSTGDKIYHLSNCPYYNQTMIDESKGEKWFCTETEAIAAGWRKAKNCP
jgi:micrococcal nuclease